MGKETFGKWLRKFRVDEELNLKQFAEQMGLSSISYISGIERGVQKPSKEFISKLMDRFPKCKSAQVKIQQLVIQQAQTIRENKEIPEDFLVLARRIYNDESARKEFISFANRNSKEGKSI